MELEFYRKKMESEVSHFIKIWLIVLVCQCYCYAIGKIVPKGFKRLIPLLPVLYLFAYLPLKLYSFNLGNRTFYFVTWLGTFKLLLFAFGKGPLSSDESKSSLSLSVFVAVASLPIKIRENLPPKPSQNGFQNGHIKTKDDPFPYPKLLEFLKAYLIPGKVLLLAIVVYITNNFGQYIHPRIAFLLTCVHLYLLLELVLVLVSAIVEFLLGIELEPTFNEPYLTSSLQDFWSKRWNLMVPDILRQAVYKPCVKMFTHVTGRMWAPVPSILATFLASGLIHEVMFYYLGREKPTWEMTRFFLLQGVCVMIEIAVKKSVADKWHWRLPWFISGPLTLGFVMLTASWFYFPTINRCKVYARASYEYKVLGTFLKNLWHRIGFA